MGVTTVSATVGVKIIIFWNYTSRNSRTIPAVIPDGDREYEIDGTFYISQVCVNQVELSEDATALRCEPGRLLA